MAEFKSFLDTVEQVNPKLKYFFGTLKTANFVFRVFTTFAPISLIICCALVTSKKLLGKFKPYLQRVLYATLHFPKFKFQKLNCSTKGGYTRRSVEQLLFHHGNVHIAREL